MHVYFFEIIAGRNEQNCIYCYSPYLKWNISFFTFFAYFLIRNMTSGKFPLKNQHPESSYSSNSPWWIPPGKFPPRIFSPMFLNIFFFFSLLSSLSLIFLKRLFCISFWLLLRLKSRSAREASNNPAFMGSCRTISHMF